MFCDPVYISMGLYIGMHGVDATDTDWVEDHSIIIGIHACLEITFRTIVQITNEWV